MKNFNRTGILAIATLLAASLGSCSEEIADVNPGQETKITATIEEQAPESRSCIDNATAGNNTFVGIMWSPDDKIGIYGTTDNNVPFTNQSSTNARKTTFAGQSTGVIKYGYFPYSEANNGRDVTNLKGTLPEEQTIYADRRLEADYKIGAAEGGALGMEVKFRHILSLIRMQINAAGTQLQDELIDRIEFTATRDGNPVGLSGDFTFSAVDGSLNPADNLGTKATARWETPASINSRVNAFMSMLPVLKSGDKMTITLFTTTRKVSFNITFGTDLQPNYFYNFPLNLSAYEGKAEYGWTNVQRDDVTVPDPEILTGTFTCAALNVDGLPTIVNKDGPGKDGTKTLSEHVAMTNWDFFAVSEDFEYNTELLSSLTAYNAGTYRGSVGAGQIFGSVADTDGLNFFWKKEGISAINETFIEYNDKEGDLYHGANACIKKGFRHYEVTVADGVTIDVYITHMNTYSGSDNTESNAYVKAVLSQLRQVRDYIVANAKKNNRPAIFMGDTNMRYTRHDIKTNLIDALNSDEITFNDPWVDFHRGGKFPTWNTRSLMIQSMFNGDKDGVDILCSDDQRGEVVDKIWYFNVPGAPLQIVATNQYNDVSSNFVKSETSATYKYNDSKRKVKTLLQKEDENDNVTEVESVTINQKTGLADHFPVVADFKWTLTK